MRVLMRLCSGGAMVAVVCLLAACSKTDATAASPSGGGGLSYEVVTIERPESVADYHKLYQATYKICAATREILKQPPPPPMLQPPADFMTGRTTYTSDGKAFLVKEEHFMYKMKDMEEPVPSCVTYLDTSSNTQMVRDGKTYDVSVETDGKRTAEVSDGAVVPDAHRDDLYTQQKTVNGFAVKCMPMLPGTSELITELCVADLKPGTLYGVEGKPIPVASRVTSVQKLASALVLEPVSIKVSQKIDPAVFDAAAK
jgi:hypothetical protein